MNHSERFGTLVPRKLPSRDELLNDLGRLKDDFERMHAIHQHTPSRELEQQMRALQQSVETILQEIRMRFLHDYVRASLTVTAILTFAPHRPKKEQFDERA